MTCTCMYCVRGGGGRMQGWAQFVACGWLSADVAISLNNEGF